jgi:hypothetical protein
MWLDTMIESAMDSTMIIEVAGEALLAGGQRQGQHEHVGVGACRHRGQAEERDGQCEEAHQQEVAGEGPAGGAEVVLVGVLDDRDLELARQAEDRGGREHVHGDPAVVEGADRVDVEARFLGARKDGFEATADIDDEDAGGDQRGELDDGLERNGRDDAEVLLLGIDVAGAEEDGEERHSSGDGEREANLVDATNAAAADTRDGVDRGRHRLQLQRDIGRDADDRDNCDQHRQPARFAETR